MHILVRIIILVVNIVDKDGTPITDGNIVFKINDLTLGVDGKLGTNSSPMKFSVVNGTVEYTLTADLYLRNSKNITVSYSGFGNYGEAKSQVVDINSIKKMASVNLALNPTVVKQNGNVDIKVSFMDITPNTNISYSNK